MATDTNDEATGSAGSVNIYATDFVSFDGVGSNGESSGAFSLVETQAIGNANDINITTQSLFLTNGALVNATTQGRGNAARIKITATDSVLIDGVGSNGLSSGVSNTVETQAVGNGSDIDIITGSLKLINGAELSSSSKGDGTAGNLRVNARSIRLDNNGLLTANTRSALVDPNSEQATININSQNLFINRNSNIFTNAAGQNVSGGNINIDTDFLIGLENSDISANSANFRGGNVRINASGVFGSQFRAAPDDRTSDITATGASPQLNGTVELNIPDIEPNRDLDNLPSVPVDTQVARTCTTSDDRQQSEFVVTGRGGLPDNPRQSLGSDAIDVDLVTLDPQTQERAVSKTSKNSTSLSPAPLVEATEWETDMNGKVVLTARASTATPNLWQPPAKCSLAN